MNIRWNAASAHPVLRTAIVGGFAVLLLRLIATGDLLLFVAPHLVVYVELAAGGLTLLTIIQARLAFLSLKRPVALCSCGGHGDDLHRGHHDHHHRHHDHHHHDHHHRHHDEGDHHGHSHEPPRSAAGNVLLYGLFLLPLLLGALMPNSALAGTLAQNKGMNLGGAAVDGPGASSELVDPGGDASDEIKQLFKTSVYNRDYAKLGMLLYRQDTIEMKDEWFIEKLQAMNLFVDAFQGKRITITGFVYREAGLAESQFIIGRMAMTHCIADISPYGIIAESPDAGQFPNDSWITVSGTIDQTTFEQRKVIRIDVDGVQPASAPSVPYVYPDWKFASKI